MDRSIRCFKKCLGKPECLSLTTKHQHYDHPDHADIADISDARTETQSCHQKQILNSTTTTYETAVYQQHLQKLYALLHMRERWNELDTTFVDLLHPDRATDGRISANSRSHSLSSKRSYIRRSCDCPGGRTRRV